MQALAKVAKQGKLKQPLAILAYRFELYSQAVKKTYRKGKSLLLVALDDSNWNLIYSELVRWIALARGETPYVSSTGSN
jgi:hypothetical protein